MGLFQKILKFLTYDEDEYDINENQLILTEETEIDSDEDIENVSSKKEKVDLTKRTIPSRLYTIEQKLNVFEKEFPNEFQSFMNRINELSQSYESALKNSESKLTFEIDPEIDGEMLGRVKILDAEIDKFIETDVRFNLLSKSLQKLIIKLNILYNTSIVYSRTEDKEKVRTQADRGLSSLKRLTDEFSDCNYILNNNRLRERIVNLFAYADYLIIKIMMKNSEISPAELLEKSAMISQFKKFDYITVFGDFAKNEIADLRDLVSLFNTEEYKKIYDKKVDKILKDFVYLDNCEGVDRVFEVSFWKTYFLFETSFFEALKNDGVNSEKVKVKVIEKMNISVNEKELWVLPVTNTLLSLINCFSLTQDKKIVVLMKLLKNISKEITYKEIYFLLLLFDVLDIIIQTPNELLKHIDKYLQTTPYSQTDIQIKKEQVKVIDNKEYVIIFEINDHEKDIIKIIEKLNFDFFVDNNKVYFNSFYFNELKNVSKSLFANTQN